MDREARKARIQWLRARGNRDLLDAAELLELRRLMMEELQEEMFRDVEIQRRVRHPRLWRLVERALRALGRLWAGRGG